METVNSVAAVVVTYNRKAKLPKVLEDVLAQSYSPQWVVVVDNASTDGTDKLLAQYGDDRLVVTTLRENTGGAGGFAAGMAKAYELGADFVWVMDDDCYPNRGALEELLHGLGKSQEALGRDVPYACSMVKYIDGSICEMNNPGVTWDWGRLLAQGQENVLVTHCSFVSVLFPRWVLTRYGLPLSEYFIWFDDQEYTRRITTEHSGVECLRSVAVHDMGENVGVNFANVTARNLWKFEYGVRNEASYRLHHQGVSSYLWFVSRVLGGLRAGNVSVLLRVRLVRKMLQAIAFDPKPTYPRSVR
jgi:GT2 family glycosyltransferase